SVDVLELAAEWRDLEVAITGFEGVPQRGPIEPVREKLEDREALLWRLRSVAVMAKSLFERFVELESEMKEGDQLVGLRRAFTHLRVDRRCRAAGDAQPGPEVCSRQEPLEEISTGIGVDGVRS